VSGRPLGGFVSGNSPAAKPAPRNADGSWPTESCTVDDPTTNGCMTPRTYHAYQQTKIAGFKHYVSCWRSGGGGEHPKGRACDWAAATGTFGGVATGAERTYGDQLAMWYVKNADRLGVLYVIWFRQIWLPGSGWRAYSGSGSPSAEHTNHVHLSVY
jgi:peptidoglycan DL-endopeptidase CwlO